MSSGNAFERLYKVQATTNKLVLDGKRDPGEVADILQRYVIDSPMERVVIPPVVEGEKFALLVDLGIITVPDDCVHENRLTTFGKQNRKKFHYYNDEITDKNFPNPTRVLKPGDKLRVRAFKQVVGGTTTSSERMTFLKCQPGNVFTGAQGLAHVFEQKRNQLPKGMWYASFDEADRLSQDADGYHRVPYVYCNSNGDFKFSLGYLGAYWSEYYAFLSFCDVE